MASTGRRLRTTNTRSKEDLISKLPNAILTHILSYVDTRSAVATTLLSKRWNRLWILVPNLEFYRHGWPEGVDLLVSEAHFEKFVDRVLVSNNVLSVRKICLSFGNSIEFDRLNFSWLTSIAKRDAEIVKLSLPCSQLYRMPDCFFNQKNLVELQLSSFISVFPQYVWFPSLGKIDFQQFRLCGDDSLKNLMRGCPVLTYFIVDIVEWDHALTLDICSSTLILLDIAIVHQLSGSHYNVVIDAPNVTHLILSDYVGASYDIRDVSSLVSINLDVEKDGQVLFKLLRKISHANELLLTFILYPSFTGSDLANMPIFHNLSKVTLAISDENHWLCLSRLFHCTPNLVTFVLWVIDDAYIAPCIWDEPAQVPPCFFSSLESVEVPVYHKQYGYIEDEMQMISYILKYATILKKMHIVRMVSTSRKQENIFLRTLLTLQKSSVACQVIYD